MYHRMTWMHKKANFSRVLISCFNAGNETFAHFIICKFNWERERERERKKKARIVHQELLHSAWRGIRTKSAKYIFFDLKNKTFLNKL